MPYLTIDFERKEHFAVVRLKSRLITTTVAAEIRQACQEITQDAAITAAVLTGANDSFCGGTDWNELSTLQQEPDFNSEQIIQLYSAAHAIGAVDKPLIAAINGTALGQGLELALACDIRLASPTARFGFPGEAMRLFPFDGATQLLPRLIGKSRSLEMLATGETIDVETALRWGLVSQVVKDKDVLTEAEALAAKMAAGAPISLRFAKEAITKGLDLTLEQGLRLEGDLYFLMHTTKDRTEGITAFREKRKAQFKGE